MSLRLIANWKLNGSKEFNQKWFREFFKSYKADDLSFLGIAPPSIYIDDLIQLTSDHNIAIGSQNIDIFSSGARTGEISSLMVSDMSAEFTLIGHSERREFFNESDDEIASKINEANKSSLIPVLCIGESDQENLNDQTHSILQAQINKGLKGCETISSLIIAYEPIWAIGSGKTPKSNEINSIHQMIKDVVQSTFPKVSLKAVLYGGSVNSENAASFFSEEAVDGALIGGASLNGEEFALIANIYKDLKS